jgi:hypothetical protein
MAKRKDCSLSLRGNYAAMGMGTAATRAKARRPVPGVRSQSRPAGPESARRPAAVPDPAVTTRSHTTTMNRAVATRSGKREFMDQGTVDLAPIRIWLRDPVP